MFIMTKIKRNMKVLAMLLVGSSVFYACTKDTSVKPSLCNIKEPTGEVFSTVPNLDFEDWYTGRSAITNETYYNPSPDGFWTTPNKGSGDLGVASAPVTVFRVEGNEAYNGYAAKLKTGSGKLLGKDIITAGSIASGQFEIDPYNPLNSLKFGRKFDRRPKSVTGYYKFTSVEQDSASAYCFVTKFDKENCRLDTLGFGRKIFYDADQTDEYKQFSFELDYKSDETPDNIVIYFSSSEGGAEFKGQPGNTLYIDEVEVDYHE